MTHDDESSLVKQSQDKLISALNKVIVYCVKLLAILMTLVVVWATFDVVFHLYQSVFTSFSNLADVNNLVSVLGTFLAVLIAIEIFLNIIFYLKRDAIHVPLVLATALTAVARKVIVIDYTITTPFQLLGTAAVVLAVGITYWLNLKSE